MAPLPKRRHSTQRQGKRRAAIKLPKLTLIKCQNCGMLIKPHLVCPNCGFYQGRDVLRLAEKKEKAKKKRKEKENQQNNPRPS